MDDCSSNSSHASGSRQRPTPSSPASLGRQVSFAREAQLEGSLALGSPRNVGLGIRPLSPPRRKTISEEDEQYLQQHIPSRPLLGHSPAPSVALSYPESDLSSPQFLSYTSLVQRQVYEAGSSDLRE